MQKLLAPNTSKLTISDIEKFYISGEKQENLTGLEYERLTFDKNTSKTASYENVAKIIEQTAKILDWDLIFDKTTLIGANDKIGNSISLEPGMQLELSIAPKKNISDIKICAEEISNLIDKIASVYDVELKGCGINPQKALDIEILNKQRYKIMNNYLPNCNNALNCPDMMRRTAGIQINVDYKDKKDCFNKLKFFNLISPFMCALLANSKNEKYISERAYIWRHTGNSRCNFFYKEALKKMFFNYRNYIEQILDVPMVYIERNNENIEIEGKITFKEFMKNGFMGYCAQYDDYILHQSLCFPDVRLKNYIEIRNHDSNSPEVAISLCAFYKGLCRCDFNELNKKFSYLKLDEVDYYNEEILVHGLDFKDGRKIVNSLIEISRNALDTDEKNYLEPLYKLAT